MPLTAKGVAKLTQKGRFLDEKGLYLQVLSETRRAWVFRYVRDGRERNLGLGPVDLVSLAEAREKALDARRLLLSGIDPVDAKAEERAKRRAKSARPMTFAEATNQYFLEHGGKWANDKHRAQFLSTLEAYAFPLLGQLPLGEVDTPLVVKVLQPIWSSKTETASRVRGRIEAVLSWATALQFRSGPNPASWRGHLDKILPAPESVKHSRHHPALPFAEMPAFYRRLQEREGVGPRATSFLVLTAGRTSEVIGLRWAEIDFGTNTWTVPAERMKAGKPHRVPLPAAALRILQRLPREDDNDFVFIGARKGSGLSNMSLTAVLQRMGREDVTIHGFRSTFRDWAAERTNYQNHIVEMSLAHTIPGKVEAAYRRGDLLDKRRELLADWADYCEGKGARAAEAGAAANA